MDRKQFPRRDVRRAIIKLDELDLGTIEVVEFEAVGPRTGTQPPEANESPREATYAIDRHDPTGLAGIWQAIARL